MKRTVSVAAVALVVVLSVAAPAVGLPVTPDGESPRWQQTTTTPAEANETAAEANGTGTSPGARLGGVVAAQGVAVGTEIESRALRHQLNQSKSNGSRAAVLARQVNQSRSRLDALRADRKRLEAGRENGTVSESEYRIRATRLSARISAVRRLNAQTSDVAAGLPRESLRRNGVNVTALRSVPSMATDVEGPQIAAIAREIAGPQEGLGPPERNGRRGQSDERGERRGSPARDRGENARSDGGPPDDRQPRSTGNETTTDDAEEPTPRRDADGGPTNSSADERGQGDGSEKPENGDTGDGDGGGGNPGSGNDGAGDGNPGRGNGAGDGDDGNPGSGNR